MDRKKTSEGSAMMSVFYFFFKEDKTSIPIGLMYGYIYLDLPLKYEVNADRYTLNNLIL